MKMTDAQRRAVSARGKDIIVSAGAGSGKTSVLVERIIDMTLNDPEPLDADKILCVTFTVSAAGELRTRIQNELRKRSGESELARKQSKRFRRAVIGTIHSFCLSLVKDYWQVLGIPVDFTIADEMSAGVMRYEALDAALDILYADESSGYSEFSELFGRSRSDKDSSDALLKFCDFLETMADPDEWIDSMRRELESEFSHQKVAKYYNGKCLSLINTAISILSSARGGAPERYSAVFDDDISYYGKLAALAAEGNLKELSETIDSTVMTRFPTRKKDTDEEEHRYYKDIRDRGKDLVSKKLASHLLPYDGEDDAALTLAAFNALANAYHVFTEELWKRKNRAKSFEFSDLERMTVTLLSEEEILDELRAKYKAVFVDEYQDVNPVQDHIFRKLTEKDHDLFAVGDLKQSIYGFRSADPAVFRDKIEAGKDPMREDSCHIALLNNFRSTRDVIKSINDIFSVVMTEKLGGTDYREEPMIPAPDSAAPSDCGMEICLHESPEADDLPHATAAYIGRLLDEGFLVRDGSEMRRAEPRDFCILLRAGSGRAKLYADALRAAGIPASSGSGDSVFETDEVSVCISLLRLIDNPMRDADAVNVMLSPLFGFTADELLRLKLENRGSLMRAAYLSGSKKAKKFRDAIEDYRKRAASMSTDELIQSVLIDSDNIILLCAGEMMNDRMNNIRTIQAMAAQYSERGGTLRGFLRMCERALETGRTRGTGTASTGNSVTVSTIHGAKGLEWPCVIVSDESKRFNMKDLSSPVVYDRQFGVGFKVRKEGEDGLPVMHKTLRYEAISMKLRDELLSEEMRLQYVALTRARDRIVLFSKFNEEKDTDKLEYYGLFKDYNELASLELNALGWMLAANSKMTKSGSARFIEVDTTAVPESKGHEGSGGHTECRDTSFLEKRISYVYPHSGSVTIPAKRSVSSIVEGQHILTVPNIARAGKMSAAERGTSVHLMMQCMDIIRAKTDLEAEMERLRRHGYMTEEELKAVDKEKVTIFLDSDLAKEMMSGKIHREYSFMFNMRAGEIDRDLKGDAADETVLVHGISDCVIEEDDGIVILDYKTDRVNEPEELINRYSKQLELYRRAIEPRFGKPIKKCVIWSFELSQEINI